ncbi:MAG: hypothetical protein CMP59_07765 [Flavobacteriales bacterium]|nr:hypothetical protein [Flavobacteriales bacterium]|tara:strand:+ start:478 stop:1164 length:687 start_codon:yes stop_codon:yes gene_type:complete
MNKYLAVLLIALAFSSCLGKHDSNAQDAKIIKHVSTQNIPSQDTIQVDLSSSNVRWKGTKMRGAGKHEGIIQLQEGYFLIIHDTIVGGEFILNMNTIEVTDIPEHEPIPRKRFNDHMKSEDFFNASKYPISKFSIARIQGHTQDSILIFGVLTIKDVSRHISFKAAKQKSVVSTKFKFDRFKWNINYEGDWIDETFVDKDIEISIELKMNIRDRKNFDKPFAPAHAPQ